MGRVCFITLAFVLCTATAIPARAAEEGFASRIWALIFGPENPQQIEQTAATRPRVWTLHPSDRSRHPERKYHGSSRSYWLFPFHRDYVIYDGGPSRGLSIGTTTPGGAVIRQGRPTLSRGIERSSVKRRVAGAFR